MRRILPVGIVPLLTLVILLMSCGEPATTSSTTSEESKEPAENQEQTTSIDKTTTSTLDPLDWLRDRPFQPVSADKPSVITTDLPEGFIATEPRFQIGQLPSGQSAQGTNIDYQRPEAGQVYVEDCVTVSIYGYDTLEARDEHLDVIEGQDYQWMFEDIGQNRVARYYNSGVDGRVWVSGPYLIVVYSGLDKSERGPWVDQFAEMYLTHPDYQY